MDRELSAMVDCPEIQRKLKQHPGGPSIKPTLEQVGDKGGWLKGVKLTCHSPELWGGNDFIAMTPEKLFHADTLLEALIQLWMWVNFEKKWKGGRWK